MLLETEIDLDSLSQCDRLRVRVREGNPRHLGMLSCKIVNPVDDPRRIAFSILLP